jgi:crotonobetainyl-CoA:carnitine CoA-transferase CaiB-like acyl-CoA transferase
MAPHGIYPCSGEDEWIAIACRDDKDWAALSSIIEADSETARDTGQWCSRFIHQQYRIDHQDDLDESMANWTQHLEKFSLEERLRRSSIPVSAVQKPGERIDQDPTTENFGLWPTTHHSKMGDVRVDGLPVHFSETDWSMTTGAPCLGEHTEDVLKTLLGKTPDEIATLREEGVI